MEGFLDVICDLLLVLFGIFLIFILLFFIIGFLINTQYSINIPSDGIRIGKLTSVSMSGYKYKTCECSLALNDILIVSEETGNFEFTLKTKQECDNATKLMLDGQRVIVKYHTPSFISRKETKSGTFGEIVNER